tara:strand:- start:590 stop:1669 length:1080 start_codon:yes stop_codon:yes gene_type:complete
MFLFKKKIFSILYILFLTLVFNFSEFSTNRALSKNFIISEVDVEEKYNINFEKSKVLDKGFLKAFKILINKILINKDKDKVSKVTIQEVKYLIDSFSIINENFINKKYKAKIEVEFDKKKIIKYLDKKRIFLSLPKEVESLVLPILIDTKKYNELYYFNQNIFFNLWNDVSKNSFLINYVLPNEDIEDYLIIKRNINNIDKYDFNEIIKKYDLKNHIILILLKNEKNLRLYSKVNFENKTILINKNYNNIDINNKSVVKNIILEIKNLYEDKWKSMNKLNTTIELPITLSINSKNFELSKKLENTLKSLDFVSDFKIEKFDNHEIIYRIIFNSTPQKFLEDMKLSGLEIETLKSVWKIK